MQNNSSIDINYTVYERSAASQHQVGRVGDFLDIANMVLFFCSDKVCFILVENICIDGGMTKLMIYPRDNGWSEFAFLLLYNIDD